MPSLEIENDSSSLTKVFFYGTLKRNEPNYEYVVEKNAKFVGEATTVSKFPLIVATNINLPFLLDKEGYGKVWNIFFKKCPLTF